ncbi:MAG: DUF3151 domain-containing protein [Candidatus Nanopelagicales bacterium]
MTQPRDLLGGPPPTELPTDPGTVALASGDNPADIARAHPTSSAAWAALARAALDRDSDIEAYAYARTGYHRGLDALRHSGWKGHGPILWAHEPNRGFLRCLDALSRTAARIGETEEAQRCETFLRDSDPEAVKAIAAELP